MRLQRVQPGPVVRRRAGTGEGDGGGRLVRQGFPGAVLHRDPGQRPGDPAGGHAGSGRGGQPHGPAPGGHQRRPLREQGRRRRPGHPLVHQHRQVPHRRQADADGDQRVLSPQPGRDVRDLPARTTRPSAARRRSPTASTSSWSWASGTSPSTRRPRGERRRISPRVVPCRAEERSTRTTPSGSSMANWPPR